MNVYTLAILVLGLTVFSGCSHLGPVEQAEQETHTSQEAVPSQTDNQLSGKPQSILDRYDLLCFVDDSTLAEYTPADHQSVWNRIRAGYQLNTPLNPRIRQHLNWYARNPTYMKRVSERATRYLHHIVEELEANHLPLELALLPIVESAFDPFAYSHGRASGMWQFIPATGKRFGLKQNWWYDGRRDVEASTQAAIKYLKYLHKRFKGDWLLALAAYNTGEGNVQKAINRNRRKGKPTDFWALKLPKETRAYVPQLLALSMIVKEPETYNIQLNDIPNKPFFARVDINSQIDLAQAAQLAEIDIDLLYLLNSGYNHWATDPQGPHHLFIPVEKAAIFTQKLQSIPIEERMGWERYTVKSGDSLLLIAKHFKTSVGSLKDVNNLNGNIIRIGQPLLIPVATQPAKHYAFSEDQRLRRKKALSRGKKGTERTTYRVASGDSLWKIANRYKVKVRDIARWNGMAPKDTLKPGQKLVIWANEKVLAKQHPRRQSAVIRKVAYQVRRGDSLARIAGKFNLSINDIIRWNQKIKKTSYIHPGQSLTLFVDVTKAY